MPDLNSVPPSPRPPAPAPASHPTPTPSAPASRRASQIFPMNPPPLPLASPGGTIPAMQQSGPHAFPPLSPVLTGSNLGASGDGAAAVPMRHPRPLTAAELHLDMEKEQEAVVNRLTRELSALRAHSASVASTASSASTAPGLQIDPVDPIPTHSGPLTGPTHLISSRRHRSSSSISRGSFSTSNAYNIPLSAATSSIPHHPRPSASSASPMDSHGSEGRMAPARTPSGMGLSSSRYEETARLKQQMEEAQRENEVLKQRIRDLEVEVRGRRASGVETVSRERSVSSSMQRNQGSS